MFEFINISHSYNNNIVLDNFSMKLIKGEVVSLLGPSGCGKTTLLRLASGIEKVQYGEIKLNNEIISSSKVHLNSEKRVIGYVFQDCALFPHLTILQNIFFGLNKIEIINQTKKIKNLMNEINILRLKGSWTKGDMLSLFFGLLPNFEHKETGKYLDQRM